MSTKVIKRLPSNARFSTLAQLRSQIKTEPAPIDPEPKKVDQDEINKNLKFAPLSPSQKAFLERVIRVDQAGELGADYIYAGQYFILANKLPQLKPILKHMWEQEVHHHNTFNRLQVERRVRPSILTPLWKLGAFSIGVSTALIGKEAAMACTVAVETVIGGHYNDQLRILSNKFDIPAKDLETNEIVHGIKSNEIDSITKTIREFRDDELEHLDTAVEHDAEKAVPYWLLTEVIKTTCKGAIWAAERV